MGPRGLDCNGSCVVVWLLLVDRCQRLVTVLTAMSGSGAEDGSSLARRPSSAYRPSSSDCDYD